MALKGENPFMGLLKAKAPPTGSPKEFTHSMPWEDAAPLRAAPSGEVTSGQNPVGKLPEGNLPSPAIVNRPIDKGEQAAVTSANAPQVATLESQSTESQMTESTRAERQRTKIKRAESKLAKIKLTESTLTESQSTPQARNKRAIPRQTRSQLTKSQMTESTLTESQSTYSQDQGHWKLAERDMLALLAEPDPAKKLRGNEWAVFFYMSLRAYEWDKEKQSRANGIRAFALKFLHDGTGLAASTCNSAVNELLAKGYLKLLEINQYTGNVYFVNPILLYRESPESRANRESVNVKSVSLKSAGMLTESQPGCSLKVSQDDDRKSVTVLDSSRSSRPLDSLSLIFEGYFSDLRSPTKAKKERDALESLIGRNRDLTEREWRMVWSFALGAKDSSGNPVDSKILWMTNGFDKFLRRARTHLVEEDRKQRLEDERAAADREAEARAQAEREAEANMSPEEVRRLIDQSLGEMPK